MKKVFYHIKSIDAYIRLESITSLQKRPPSQGLNAIKSGFPYTYHVNALGGTSYRVVEFEFSDLLTLINK